MIPPPLAPSAVLARAVRGLPDGAGARLILDWLIVTRTQHPALKRDVGSQEVVG